MSDQVADGTLIIHFGKHEGKTIEEVPSGYLRWLIDNLDPDESEYKEKVVEAAETELAFRDDQGGHFYE